MTGYDRRILIVEDDAFVGSLLADALSTRQFTARVATTALQANRQLKSFDPDIVLVDINLGQGPNGIDFIHMVRKAYPHIAAILLSKHADSASAGLAGVHIPDGVGYLRKSLVHDTNALVESINAVVQGHSENLRHDRQAKGDIDLLTSTQREILRMMALGMSNKEIAKTRAVSIKSVENRVAEIFKAFNIAHDDSVAPRVEAVRRYVAVSGLPER